MFSGWGAKTPEAPIIISENSKLSSAEISFCDALYIIPSWSSLRAELS